MFHLQADHEKTGARINIWRKLIELSNLFTNSINWLVAGLNAFYHKQFNDALARL